MVVVFGHMTSWDHPNGCNDESYKYDSSTKKCEAPCSFTCPDDRCIWSYNFLGRSQCTCNEEGANYNKDTKLCEAAPECSFTCPDDRCVWSYDFIGRPKCSCNDAEAEYNKSTETCG